MAINVSFAGSTIYRAGAYSRTEIDLGGGFPLSPTGIVAIYGESDAGTPGADEPSIANNVYSPEGLGAIRAKYGSGPIVDAAAFLFAPASDGAIPAGAQALYIYKTNASVRASMALANSYGTLTAREYGQGGNLVSFKNLMTAETAATHTGSATIASGAVNTGSTQTLVISINGADPVSYTVAVSANRAALLVLLNSNFTGLTFTASVTDKIVITQDTSSNHHRNGFGRSFQIYATSTSLAAFGFTAGLYTPAAEPSSAATLYSSRDLIEETDTLGGSVVLGIGYQTVETAVTAATVTISATAIVLTVTGGTSAGITTLLKANYPTLASVVTAIQGLNAAWNAALPSDLYAQLSTEALDYVTTIGAMSGTSSDALFPCRLKRDAQSAAEFFDASSLVGITSQATKGLPDQVLSVLSTGVNLANGAKGGTTSAECTAALTEFTKVRVNAIVPLFSRNYSEDVTDLLTDAASTYTIAGIHQGLKTHLSLMATVKRKSERQGYLSQRASYSTIKAQAGTLADFRCQLVFQDVKQNDSQGNLIWFQPWALACLVAGARSGSPIGTPLTFKYLNCSGIRHTAQVMTTVEEDIVLDFDPITQGEDAIRANLTFLESPQSGGFRLAMDNTTYGKDGNWVYNRGHVLYAADVLAYDFRTQTENIFVGKKNTLSANEAKAICESILATYLSQGITVSTSDAPLGFKALIVRLNGNTLEIDVTVKLVEGIDFVLERLTLSRASGTA